MLEVSKIDYELVYSFIGSTQKLLKINSGHHCYNKSELSITKKNAKRKQVINGHKTS